MISENPDFQVVNSAYPMFGGFIKRLWGSAEMVSYLKELQASTEGPASQNFSHAVVQAIRNLTKQHDEEFPHLLPHLGDNIALQTVTQAFPGIGEKLARYWGTKEFHAYMSGLLQNDRGVERKGFPFEILMALHTLAEKHNKDFKHLFPTIDIWTQFSG